MNIGMNGNNSVQQDLIVQLRHSQVRTLYKILNHIETGNPINGFVDENINCVGKICIGKADLPDWVQNLKLNGDFRLRDQYQRKRVNSGSSDSHLAQNRGRFRARLNLEGKVNDKLKVIFGLATEGGKDNGTLANTRSNNI